jgi:hypothetical protein
MKFSKLSDLTLKSDHIKINSIWKPSWMYYLHFNHLHNTQESKDYVFQEIGKIRIEIIDIKYLHEYIENVTYVDMDIDTEISHTLGRNTFVEMYDFVKDI